MSMTSAIGSGGNSAWADASATRANAFKAKMFAKADADGSGGVNATELQTLFDKIAKKTGNTAADASQAMTSFDADGSGSLSSDELDQGMKSLMPAPSSTVDFAQQRMGGPGGPGGSPGHGGPPPPDNDGEAGTSSTNSSTSATDPLDTNQDGTVSAQELAAGMVKQLAQALVTAMDSNTDGNISQDEVSAFQSQLQSAAAAGSESSAAHGHHASNARDIDSAREKGSSINLQSLADFVKQAYSQVALQTQSSASASVSLSA